MLNILAEEFSIKQRFFHKMCTRAKAIAKQIAKILDGLHQIGQELSGLSLPQKI